MRKKKTKTSKKKASRRAAPASRKTKAARTSRKSAAAAERPLPATQRPAPVIAPVLPPHRPPAAKRQSKAPPAILIMGPTASGKTALAVELVKQLPCEIISVDSAQLYKGMNVGTGKPGPEVLSRAPHHLLDIIEPHESYSAARFRDDALTLMREITERERIPLLVGGTMLYFKALIEGLSELPEADPVIRLVIDTMAEQEGWPAVHAKLGRVDPETAARLDPNDAQRIQRAMEVYSITNKPMSELLRKPRYVYFPYTAFKIALVPGDREVLHERIARRFQAMLDAGLVAELKGLREEYGLEAGMPSMRCVGYRQAWEHLEGRLGADALREEGIAATRQLAKRQLTWLRAMDGVTEFDCLADDLPQMVLEYLRHELEALVVAGEA